LGSGGLSQLILYILQFETKFGWLGV